MTIEDIQRLNHEPLRRAIAEAIGWTDLGYGTESKGCRTGWLPSGQPPCWTPDDLGRGPRIQYLPFYESSAACHLVSLFPFAIRHDQDRKVYEVRIYRDGRFTVVTGGTAETAIARAFLAYTVVLPQRRAAA